MADRKASVRVEPIAADDTRGVAEFLHRHLNSRVTVDSWERAQHVPWKVTAPNHGFLLRDQNDDIVGAYLAFYSERTIDGKTRRFCNLGAWCVLPESRFHSLKLLRAMLAQDGYEFTDLSPTGNVRGVNARYGFQFLDTASSVSPNLPWAGRGRVSSDPAVIEDTLIGDDLQIYRDLAGTEAARHVVLRRGDRYCYVVFRVDRRKHLPLFGFVLHVTDPELFRAMHRSFRSHLLLRYAIPATIAEDRVAGARPRLSVRLPDTRRKMFRSADLADRDIDYLYSEMTCLSW